MVTVKTAKERIKKKKEEQAKRDKIIFSRFNELRKNYSVTDAVVITANEFNLSLVTVYNIRKRQS